MRRTQFSDKSIRDPIEFIRSSCLPCDFVISIGQGGPIQTLHFRIVENLPDDSGCLKELLARLLFEIDSNSHLDRIRSRFPASDVDGLGRASADRDQLPTVLGEPHHRDRVPKPLPIRAIPTDRIKTRHTWSGRLAVEEHHVSRGKHRKSILVSGKTRQLPKSQIRGL